MARAPPIKIAASVLGSLIFSIILEMVLISAADADCEPDKILIVSMGDTPYCPTSIDAIASTTNASNNAKVIRAFFFLLR